MKKAKKIAAFSLAALMALSAVGCGQKKKTDNDSTAEDLTNTTETISVHAEKAWKPYFQAAIDRVKEKYPNATINIIEAPVFDHLEVITNTDVLNKDVADVFSVTLDGIREHNDNENLLAIDAKEMAKEIGGFGDFDKGIGGLVKVGEDYFAMPFNLETLILFANTKNAKAQNIDLTKTFDFDSLDKEDVLVQLHNSWYAISVINSTPSKFLAKDENGKLMSEFTKDYKDLSDDDKALFESMYKYWKAHNESGTVLWDKAAAAGYIDENFKDGGKTSLLIEGPWAAASANKATDGGKNLEVLPLNQLTVAGKPMAHWKSGWALAINSRVEGNAAKTALSKELIKELLNPKYAKELFEAAGKIMPNVPVEDYMKTDLSDINKKIISAVVKSYKTAIEKPNYSELGKALSAWETAVLSWESVKPKSAEQAYKKVQLSMQSYFKTLG